MKDKKEANVIKSGYGIVQIDIMESSLSVNAKCVYAILCARSGSNGDCYLSVGSISKALGRSQSITKEAIKELVLSRVVRSYRRYSENGKQTTNKYKPVVILDGQKFDGKSIVDDISGEGQMHDNYKEIERVLPIEGVGQSTPQGVGQSTPQGVGQSATNNTSFNNTSFNNNYPEKEFSGNHREEEVEDIPKNSEEKKEKEKGSAQKEKEAKFDEFWKIYGKPVDKKKSKNKFMKIPFDKMDSVIRAANQYTLKTPDIKYRKHPTTWLNGECWEDEDTTAVSIQTLNRKSFEEIKSFFLDTYLNINHIGYVFDAKEYEDINEIQTKVRSFLINLGLSDPSMDDIVMNTKLLIQASTADDWLKTHLTLSNINKQFNAIISKTQNNGRFNKRTNGFQSAHERSYRENPFSPYYQGN